MRRRVVITGLGPVSNVGTGIAEFGRSLRAGTNGTKPVRSFDTSGFSNTTGGEIPDFDPSGLLTRLDPATGQWGRSSLFAASAARLAADDAGLDLTGSRAAVVVGTTFGEGPVLVRMAEIWHRDGWQRPDPQAVAQSPGCRLGLAAAQELGTNGEVVTFGTACAAGNYALGYAYDLITTRQTDVAVAGGADSVNRFIHAGFHRMGAVAADVCRPFDVNRDGLVPAEGGVALVLEELEHAQARGARIYAELLGYAMTCDAMHPVAPDAGSIARCIRTAHRRAGIAASEVDYICAHGTGTKMNDSTESQAVRDVFGARPPAISSIKSMLGHTMGAAAAFGAVACTLAIWQGFMPPTTNHQATDPSLADMDIVANSSRTAPVRIAQNNGFAFGGNNAVVLIGGVS